VSFIGFLTEGRWVSTQNFPNFLSPYFLHLTAILLGAVKDVKQVMNDEMKRSEDIIFQ